MKFDKNTEYQNEVQPLVDKLRAACSKNGIPMFFAFCVSNDEENSSYVNEAICPASHDIELTKDLFPLFINVTLGFKTVPPIKETEIFFDAYDSDDSDFFADEGP